MFMPTLGVGCLAWVCVFKSFYQLVKRELINLPSPAVLSYWWGLGICLGAVYLFQLSSGLILSLLYVAGSGSFESVVSVMQDVNFGWLLRFLHSSGASLFLLLLYLHLYRGLMYGSFLSRGVWQSGVITLVLVMGAAFLGYVLPWGKMSYWGMVVVTSMLSAIPYLGNYVMELLWGGVSPGFYSITRFFSLHYAVSLAVSVLVLVHLYELHQEGSSNPLGVSKGACDSMAFHSGYTYKDVVGLALVLLFYWYLVTVNPHIILDPINFEEVDVMVTPTHIKPEWYFLFMYCILRSVPSKVGGVIMMGSAILVLWCFSYFSGFGSRVVGSSFYKICLVLYVMSFMTLTWLGGLAVEEPFSALGVVFSVLYFLSVVGLWCSMLVYSLLHVY